MFWQASKDAVPDTRLFVHDNRMLAERAFYCFVTVDGITKGGPAGVLLPAGMKKKYFRKSFSLSMLLSYKSDVTGV